MKILVLNAGSSSQKIRLYEVENAPPELPPAPLWRADADWTKQKGSVELKITTRGQTMEEKLPAGEHAAVVKRMVQMLWSGKTAALAQPSEVSAVGHRVVHGGPDYTASTLITPQVRETIQRLASFTPLHNPVNLEGIEAIDQALGAIPQVAVFDTAFHRTLPREVATYPGPYHWYEQGIRRYGFHGISHQYCSRRSAQIVGRPLSELRIVNCHLGNGCSLAAIRQGQSIDTTMGFTPLEGLMMGTRSGTIDPSIPLYLEREQGLSAQQLEQVLNKESGLKGISGVSADLRQVMQASSEGNERARLALDMFVYRLRTFIGAMVASLGGLDVLTFTGGIGENAASIRARACEGLAFLNLKLDPAKNSASPTDQDIAAPSSAVRVLVVHTEEDWEIAREVWQVMHR